jgi:hypothetical protein
MYARVMNVRPLTVNVVKIKSLKIYNGVDVDSIFWTAMIWKIFDVQIAFAVTKELRN